MRKRQLSSGRITVWKWLRAFSNVKRHMTSFMIIHDLNYFKTFLLQKWSRDDSFWVHSSVYCPLDICLNQLNIRSGGKCGFLLWPKTAFTLDSRSQEVKHQSTRQPGPQVQFSASVESTASASQMFSTWVFILHHCLLFIRSFTVIEMRSLKSKPERN